MSPYLVSENVTPKGQLFNDLHSTFLDKIGGTLGITCSEIVR